MQLQKTIPAMVKTLKATWCREFLEMTPQYREVRRSCRSKMDTCYWCRHYFADGEMMSLACFVGSIGNRVLCCDCADELLASEESSSTE